MREFYYVGDDKALRLSWRRLVGVADSAEAAALEYAMTESLEVGDRVRVYRAPYVGEGETLRPSGIWDFVVGQALYRVDRWKHIEALAAAGDWKHIEALAAGGEE